MIDEDSLVRVKAKRKVIYELGKEVPLAIIRRCPLCNQRHLHGWGSEPRGSHCGNIRGASYFLVCAETPTIGERIRARVSPVLAKAQLWFELKIMLPVLYALNSRSVWW